MNKLNIIKEYIKKGYKIKIDYKSNEEDILDVIQYLLHKNKKIKVKIEKELKEFNKEFDK